MEEERTHKIVFGGCKLTISNENEIRAKCQMVINILDKQDFSELLTLPNVISDLQSELNLFRLSSRSLTDEELKEAQSKLDLC